MERVDDQFCLANGGGHDTEREKATQKGEDDHENRSNRSGSNKGEAERRKGLDKQSQPENCK